jgi:outer membrane receptor protein involved in Fe transport
MTAVRRCGWHHYLRAASRRGRLWRAGVATVVCVPGAALSAQAPGVPGAGASAASLSLLTEITVTAERLDLTGTATTASQGVVAQEELQLSPAYRPGQLLETVPGLIATLHSGEGKANQFLMRGYNLDHGTDLAVFVDGMPINQPTHAHGQGYTDLNFLIPELADGVQYTKGPYYAAVGDFGALGSVGVSYRDTIADQLSAGVGEFDYRRVFVAASQPLASGNLLAATEIQRYDGPFATPDDARKENLVLRYSQADGARSYAVTGMYYHQIWTNTTDVPARAVAEGEVADRFGTLNPSDGGRAERASLAVQYHQSNGTARFSCSSYLIHNELHIFNDFTHFLIDPIHGDQEDQFENRDVAGAAADYSVPLMAGLLRNELAVGVATRYDSVAVGRLPSENRVPLAAQTDPPFFSDSDQVYLFSGAAYAQAITHWTPRWRTVIGIRDDFQHGTDIDYLSQLHARAGFSNAGTARQSLWQPKASVIFASGEHLELYASAGRGFHSADLRGVIQDRSADLKLPGTPLLARQVGEEIGLRAEAGRNFAFTVAVYNLYQQSETTYDPDIGEDVAGPPSRRYGFELNATWQILPWLEFYGSFSGNHSRFTRDYDDGSGHLGTYIPDAPSATGRLAFYVTNFGRWSGGLAYRYLGDYPLSSGPCTDAAVARDFPGVSGCSSAPTAIGEVSGRGFGQLNLDVRYAGDAGWETTLGVYNLLNTHAAAAEFWYVDRLRGEIAAYPDGRADIHEHPLEPFMVRFTVSRKFGS